MRSVFSEINFTRLKKIVFSIEAIMSNEAPIQDSPDHKAVNGELTGRRNVDGGDSGTPPPPYSERQ